MPRFFLPKERIRGHRGLIAGDELRHLKRVLRLRPGDAVTLFDDAGWEHEGVVRSYAANQGEIEILKSHRAERESSLPTVLALGLTKGAKADWVVEKATELGVHAIAPFLSAHAVPKLDGARIARRAERWKKIALSAAKQCGRSRIAEIHPVCRFDELIERPWPGALKLIFWEREAERGLSRIKEAHPAPPSVVLAVGPEGGFSAEEIEEAAARGFETVGLGKRILRAETAAVAALALAQFLWGDMA